MSSDDAKPVLPPHRSGAIRDPRLPLNPYSDDQQPWPGLVEKMDPLPDHGETSYQGHGRLTGKRALITGADSGIGRLRAAAIDEPLLRRPQTGRRPWHRPVQGLIDSVLRPVRLLSA